MTSRLHPIDTVIGKLESAVTVARHELQLLQRPCGADLPAGVLGYGVWPCPLPQGHAGEHQSTSKVQGQPVAWDDESSPWTGPTSRPARQQRQR